MAIPAGRSYDIRINTLGGDMNVVSSLVQDMWFYSEDLVKGSYDFSSVNVPLVDGGADTGGGYKKSRVIQLYGTYLGLVGNENEEYPGAHIGMIQQLFESLDRFCNEDMYIDFETQKLVSTTSTRRLFVKPVDRRFVPVDGTRYTAGQVIVDMSLSDPNFYESGASLTATASATSGSAVTVVSNTLYPSQRCVTRVTNQNGSALTGVTASSVTTGEYWAITGTISGSGDYWEVDHFLGTVIQNVGGTETDIVSGFVGSFFPLAAGTNIINITTGASGAHTDVITYRRKAGYGV